MDCSQILPGAVNPGACSLAAGYYCDNPFIAYASGKDVVILDGRMKHLQTVLGSDCGYADTQISCIHCAELVGRIAVAWGSDVVIFEPELVEDSSASSNGNEFRGQWCSTQTLTLDFPVLSLCWNQVGSHLAIGGKYLTMWNFEVSFQLSPSSKKLEGGGEGGEGGGGGREGGGGGGGGRWKEVWRWKMALPIVHLKFSPDGAMFASVSETDCLVKIWYPSSPVMGGIGSGQQYSFVYVAHPKTVTGFVWRNTSPFMPKGCVANVLLTYCQDNICRLWSHLLSTEKRQRLRFYIAASIDPVADIPFRSTMPMQDMPFVVHWLNNKETTFTSKAEKTYKGTFQPLSRHSSLASFASSLNEEMFQSWVCIEEADEPTSDPQSTSTSGSIRKPQHVYSFSSFLNMPSQKPSPHASSASPQHQDSKLSVQRRQFAHLLDEWCTSPDLLLCIHPKVGSLMVWTVEGLDAPYNTSRLAHVSFSSCLPHVFPPHLAQSLRQELLQYLIKEPDVVQTREMATSGSVTDISLPVPQIKIASSGSMSDVVSKEDVPKTKADSTLILVSSHLNGSLNTWSVELTVQSNACTSIAGFIHCGETGGHHSEVRAVYRHPWLPVLMTVSSDGTSSKDKSSNSVESELIIWNSDLPGPLEHKSHLNELSRMFSPNPFSFHYVTWVPPISVSNCNEGVFARCPSSGLFVANVGNELRLYQTSLYCMTKPQPSAHPHENSPPTQGVKTSVSSLSGSQQEVIITSHLGKEGITFVSMIEKDLSTLEQIVALNAFRMCSLVTSFDIKKSLGSKFCRDIVVALVENQTVRASSSSPGSRGTRSFLHLWRVTICSKFPVRSESPLGWKLPSATPDVSSSSLPPQPVSYAASVEKVSFAPFPLPSNVHIVQSTPACDIASSLQLQLPTLSAPYLFTTACSDGTIHCWQILLRSTANDNEAATSSTKQPTCARSGEKEEQFEFELYEVFSGSSAKESGSPADATRCLDCYKEEALRDLPTVSYVPCAISCAYPGRFAMAHQLTKSIRTVGSPPKGLKKTNPSTATNPLDQHAVVTVWECESSGGLKWSCEATLPLSGLTGVMTSKSPPANVFLDWLPMENGAYLLATCFASIISIYGMTLPQSEGQSTALDSSTPSHFRPLAETTLSTKKSQATVVCLLQFPCSKPYPGLSISCFSYTGSNSLLLSVGSEMHLYSCWVKRSRLQAFTPSKEDRKLVPKSPSTSRVFRETSPGEATSKPASIDVINLLDYAHTRNTPLPQYHPKILVDLMNLGKLHAVKAILINLVRYLLLYEGKKKRRNYFEDGGFEALCDDASEKETKRMRLLSVSSDGYLRRSKNVKPKFVVESIPQLPLSKLGIFKRKDAIESHEESQTAVQDEDDLFASAPIEEYKYGFETESEGICFDNLDPETCEFTPKIAQKLSSLLKHAQLADLSDLEQVRLLAIAETVANTKTSLIDSHQRSQQQTMSASYEIGLGLSNSMGAGYASTGLSHGVRGGEAMDDCGLRYLLALENYVTLSQSLPKGVSPGRVSAADFIWAFHSDAEMELLSAVPCVQKDDLSWDELRNTGVGWWLRSSDTLRRVIEKLAKTQFMQNQDPLDASLFYLAMKKKTLLKGLFRTVHESRMMAFFSNDFTQERWKKAALKNAFALLAKQRFEHAAAFFLLADKLWDAVQVCISRLGDLQLAFVITRLYEGDNGPVYERLLKESVLGISVNPGSISSSRQLEASCDPFMRSIAHWLLQDYSGALETLLIAPTEKEPSRRGTEARRKQNCPPDPAIFNFYFFLRSHPLLLRRGYGSRAAKSLFQTQPHSSKSPRVCGHSLSGVGNEPLTPAERGLLFSTAYHHLTHGCPLLALDVLSKLPKSCNLGSEVSQTSMNGGDYENEALAAVTSRTEVESRHSTKDSMVGMIQSGTLGDDFGFGGAKAASKMESEDDFDWSQPVSSHFGGGGVVDDDEFDWGQPVSSQVGGFSEDYEHSEDDEDEDWSKPVSSKLDALDLSPPNTNRQPSPEKETHDGDKTGEDEETDGASSTLSTWGLFILSLAEQLQYNACLSILTEELNTIYIPACCNYLWEAKGKDSLPILPLAVQKTDQNLAAYYKANAFEKTVLSLRGMLVEWLRSETKIVKEVCGFELVEEDPEDVLEDSAPAGYDVLTTLMNYTALHASTTPSLLTMKLELMHLMNTLLPWETTGHSQVVQDLNRDTLPTFAVDPAQLPILTSCSLPARHLTNLALHLSLMSASIIEILATHTCPPISSKPIPHVNEVFDLCCAISHCLTVCLSPMRPADVSMTTASRTPTQSFSQGWSERQQQQLPEGKSPAGSPRLLSGRPKLERGSSSSFESFSHLGTPNTKPSKWPGVDNWPNTLGSDEGKDPTPLSLVLVECSIAVYLGLLAAAWSWHSPSDLLTLLKNAPTHETWYSAFGGGMDVKKGDEKGKRSKSFLMQTVSAMTRRIKMIRKGGEAQEEGWSGVGLFIAPKRTLLDHYLSLPSQDRWKEDLHEPEVEEEEATELETSGDIDGGLYMEVGPTFYPGSRGEEESKSSDHDSPDSFPWCLMNLCITKMVQDAVRKVLSTAGLEVLELVTASPVLYSALKVMDEWESIFTRRLDALGAAPDDLFDNEEEESPMFGVGPALMKHKFILEPENSPFKSCCSQLVHGSTPLAAIPQVSLQDGQEAKQLWEYLVHQEDIRESFIHYIFTNKRVGSVEDNEPECRVVHKDPDSIVSSFCINSCNPTVLALALPREVIEIEVPDVSALDTPYGDELSEGSTPPNLGGKRSHSAEEDFVLVQSASFRHNQRYSVLHPSITYAHGMHAQTGTSSSMLMRRPVPGVRRMAPHPNLTYYLTGSLDGSVNMYEFSTPHPVSTQRRPGSGAVTRIRFTPQGNKYGITDAVGKLQLWQGIHTSNSAPFQTLVSGMRYLNDFLFLGSSSFIAACGDAPDNKNLCMWDTLLPPKRSIVKEYICHESGATSLGYSQSKQRLFCGGKKGELYIFDIRQYALLQCLQLHNAAVNCIAVNDVGGYFVSGSADGDIKVLDLNTITELTSFIGEHAKSRLFRSEGGVTDLSITHQGKLYSCGADGTIKSRTINL